MDGPQGQTSYTVDQYNLQNSDPSYWGEGYSLTIYFFFFGIPISYIPTY